MSRLALFSISILLFCGAGVLLSLNGCGGGNATFTVPPPPNSKIQHVVIIFQENRTPDNLFQGLCLPPNGSSSSCSTSPTASQYDIASSGVNSLGATLPLTPIDLGTSGSDPDNYDLSHAHSAFVKMCDLNGSNVCKMDGADLGAALRARGVNQRNRLGGGSNASRRRPGAGPRRVLRYKQVAVHRRCRRP